jgi:hypothetical protein
MEMISHQAMGVNQSVGLGAGLGQCVEETQVILRNLNPNLFGYWLFGSIL